MQSGSKFKIDTSIDIPGNKYRRKKKKKRLAYSTALNATRFNTLLSGCVTSIDDMNGETNNGKNTKKDKISSRSSCT